MKKQEQLIFKNAYHKRHKDLLKTNHSASVAHYGAQQYAHGAAHQNKQCEKIIEWIEADLENKECTEEDDCEHCVGVLLLQEYRGN